MADDKPLDEQGPQELRPPESRPEERSKRFSPGKPAKHEGMGQGPKKVFPPRPPKK